MSAKTWAWVPFGTRLVAPGPASRGGGVGAEAAGSRVRGVGRLRRGVRNGMVVAGYLARFIPGVLRPHRLVVPDRMPWFESELVLTESEVRGWNSFYGCESAAVIPFTYFTPANSRLMFALLRGLRVNFRHLFLVRHEVGVGSAGQSGLIPGRRYALRSGLEEVQVLPRNRVMLVCQTEARLKGSDTIALATRDHFLVRDVAPETIAALEAQGRGRAEPVAAPTELRIDATQPGGDRQRMVFERSSGLEFGLLSGDLNLAHVHPGIARWFGHRRAFAQGLLTSNAVMARLVNRLGRAPRGLSIRFCRPILLGQEVELRILEPRFEVVDPKGILLAAGDVRL